MASKKDVRPIITLACTECKERNYTTEKNRRNDPGRMELKKYCPRCRKHTAAPGDEVKCQVGQCQVPGAMIHGT